MSRQSLKITSTVSMQLRTIKYHTIVSRQSLMITYIVSIWHDNLRGSYRRPLDAIVVWGSLSIPWPNILKVTKKLVPPFSLRDWNSLMLTSSPGKSLLERSAVKFIMHFKIAKPLSGEILHFLHVLCLLFPNLVDSSNNLVAIVQKLQVQLRAP